MKIKEQHPILQAVFCAFKRVKEMVKRSKPRIGIDYICLEEAVGNNGCKKKCELCSETMIK